MNILIGIKNSLISSTGVKERKLTDFQFEKTCKTDMKEFVFEDFAPVVFRRIRDNYGIQELDYMQSLGPGLLLEGFFNKRFDAITMHGSTGKSGSMFYFTKNKKFLVKDIH